MFMFYVLHTNYELSKGLKLSGRIYRLTDLQTFRRTGLQIYILTDSQTYRLTNLQTYRRLAD